MVKREQYRKLEKGGTVGSGEGGTGSGGGGSAEWGSRAGWIGCTVFEDKQGNTNNSLKEVVSLLTFSFLL